MISKRSFSTVLVVAATCLAASPVGAAADDAWDDQLRHDAPRSASVMSAMSSVTSNDTCGPITEDTVMTARLRDCWDGVIAGDGVTVDLAGLTVGQVLVDGSDVVLRNGTVEAPGAFGAIYVNGSDVLLERLTVQNSTGFVVEAGPRTTVRDSLFRDNTGVAVDQFYGSGLVVERTRFVDNDIAVSIQDGADAIIERNRFEGNRIGVNVWDEDWTGARNTTVRRNTFDRNDVGVRVRAIVDATGTLIEHNTIRRSTTSGILVTSTYGPSAADTVIRDNVVQRSGERPEVITVCDDSEEMCVSTTADDGITVLAADPVVLPSIVVAGNKAMHNAGHGIEAPGVTDGGRNVAVRNGAGGCIGVSCRGR